MGERGAGARAGFLDGKMLREGEVTMTTTKGNGGRDGRCLETDVHGRSVRGWRVGPKFRLPKGGRDERMDATSS